MSIVIVLLGLSLAVIGLAWLDAGREEMRPIETPVSLPAAVAGATQ